MMPVKAVFFDFGGTLFDYRTTAVAEFSSLMDTLKAAGANPEETEVVLAYRQTMKAIFKQYLPKPYYLHRDLFQDAFKGLLERLNISFKPEYFEQYRAMQWERLARDIRLREGVIETLAELKKRQLVLGIVSNIDEDQLTHLIHVTGIEPHFDFFLSSEKAESCKPDPVIFEKALDLAGCSAEEVIFVGDALKQDIAGANKAGFNSVLIWHGDDKEPPDTGPVAKFVIARIPDILDLI